MTRIPADLADLQMWLIFSSWYCKNKNCYFDCLVFTRVESNTRITVSSVSHSLISVHASHFLKVSSAWCVYALRLANLLVFWYFMGVHWMEPCTEHCSFVIKGSHLACKLRRRLTHRVKCRNEMAVGTSSPQTVHIKQPTFKAGWCTWLASSWWSRQSTLNYH